MKIFSALWSDIKIFLLALLFPLIAITIFAMAMGFSEVMQDTVCTVAGNFTGIIIAILYLGKKELKVKEAFRMPDISLLLSVLIFQFCWLIFSNQFFFVIFSDESESYEMSLLAEIGTFTLVPIAEEIIFRYGMINLGKKSVGVFVSSALSALLFTLVHFASLPASFCIFGAAVFYTLIYCLTGNLVYTTVAHALNNLFDTLASHLIEDFTSTETPSELVNPYFFVVIVGMIISALSMIIRFKKIKGQVPNLEKTL